MESILFGELDKCDLDCAFEAFYQRHIGAYKSYGVAPKRWTGTVHQFESLLQSLCEAGDDEDFDFWVVSGPAAVQAIREGRKKRGG